MMRCEHVAAKKHPLTRKWRLRPCRCRLKSVIPKLVVGDLTWHVYRCRRGHATRYYVKP